eukprot:4841862-Alexandrium_andersonii.AAC.1
MARVTLLPTVHHPMPRLEFPAAFRIRLSLLPCFDQEAASGSQCYKALARGGSSPRQVSPSVAALGPASASAPSDTESEDDAVWRAANL